MQVTETSAEGLKRAFKVVVDSADIEKSIAQRLTTIGKQVKLPGFRPGKVPAKILRQRYGKSVMGEVLQEAIDGSAQKAMAEQELKPAMQPKIEVTQFDEGTDLEYTMEVEVLPDFEVFDPATLKLERLVAKPGDTEVDEALDRLADQQKTFSAAPEGTAAAEGMAVLIDFEGKRDGVAFEGGAASDFQIVLGSAQFIPGFEEQLVGAKPGDHRTVNVTFPEGYQSEELAGQDAVFEVDVKEVREAQLPAIDDELATKLGMDNLAALRERVRDQIAREYSGVSRERLKRKLLDALDDAYDFALPPGLVEAEFDSIWKRVEEDRKQGHVDDDAKSKDDDQLKEEYNAIAERRVRLGLVLSKVGEANNITVGQEELNRAISTESQRHPGQEREIFEFFQKNPQAAAQIQAPLFEEKVVDYILEIAEVTESTVTPEELLADPDEDMPAGEKAVARSKAKKSKAPAAATKGAKAKSKAKAAAEKAPEGKKKPAAKRASRKKSAS